LVYRIVRCAIQLAFLLLFLVFFALTRYGTRFPFPNLFLRLDPLVLLVTSIAGRTLVTGALLSLVLVALTLVFGRFFCGFVCPLGTIIDACDTVLPHRRKPVAFPIGKYVVLLFLVLAALLGASFIGWFDPLVITDRVLALVAYPLLSRVAAAAGQMRPVAFAEAFVAPALFLAVLALSLLGPRFWCRNLCPLGGLLALLSKVSLFRFAFRGDCRACGRCERVCPTGAINQRERELDSGECIECMACRYECPDSTIRYRPGFAPVRFDAGRRQALVAVGSAVVLAPLARVLVRAKLRRGLVRPPGAIPEPDFLNACLRCGLCIKACPTNCLQPCVLEAGVGGLWTPHAVARIGGCEKNCNACGQACPTGAIRRLSLEEKTYARMGIAAVERGRCIAWADDRHCLICDEVCPYDAIEAVSMPGDEALKPVVDKRMCIGCGLCESRCPVEGPAAIRVSAQNEERRRKGSYITEEKRRLRKCGQTRPEEIPSGFILDEEN
jgi:MauM/NapG family ferredoxin protein